jgi:hypothetical protein
MSLGLSGRKRHIEESQTKTSNYQRDKRELFTNIDSASFPSSSCLHAVRIHGVLNRGSKMKTVWPREASSITHSAIDLKFISNKLRVSHQLETNLACHNSGQRLSSCLLFKMRRFVGVLRLHLKTEAEPSLRKVVFLNKNMIIDNV